jgi:hypothetical protein
MSLLMKLSPKPSAWASFTQELCQFIHGSFTMAILMGLLPPPVRPRGSWLRRKPPPAARISGRLWMVMGISSGIQIVNNGLA